MQRCHSGDVIPKVIFAAGLVSFVAAFITEITFILLGLTAVSGGSSTLPGWVSGLVIWGCIGLGVLCWLMAAALVLVRYLRNRAQLPDDFRHTRLMLA
jgi:hypothetical protein